MTAAFASIPFAIKQTQIFPNLPHRRRPNLTLSTTASNKSYFTALSEKHYFATANTDISSHLLLSLPTTLHPTVKTPILRLLSSPIPPTIAPSLCLAATELLGGNPNIALNAACALHLIHIVAHARTALINHQPLIQWRNQNFDIEEATEFTLGTELLIGDGVLALVYEMVARTPASDAETATRVLKVLMEVATTAITVASVDEEQREGKLAACAAVCGVILGGGNEEEVERARRLEMSVGKMELAEAEVDLELGFEEARARAVRCLLQEMLSTQLDS